MIKLSPSALNLYSECPRCFWWQIKHGIRRPQGPMSSLPSGIDYVLKFYFDHFRGKKSLPPILDDKNLKIEGQLVDQNLVYRFRSRNFGYKFSNLDVWFGGMLDDAIILPDGSIVPLDNKTRGFPPKETHQFHINQMSAYTLLLKKNGFRTKNFAYLIHWFTDHRNVNLDNPLGFNIAVEKVETNPDQTIKILKEATQILKENEPSTGAECQFCNYLATMKSTKENKEENQLATNQKKEKKSDKIKYPKDSLFGC